MTAEYRELPELIHSLRRGVVRKPNAAARHLSRRRLRSHLPPDASISNYEAVYVRVLETTDASIYVYYKDQAAYLPVAARLNGRLWLVIASFEGVMTTAFVVENPTLYLERAALRYVGKMNEVIS